MTASTDQMPYAHLLLGHDKEKPDLETSALKIDKYSTSNTCHFTGDFLYESTACDEDCERMAHKGSRLSAHLDVNRMLGACAPATIDNLQDWLREVHAPKSFDFKGVSKARRDHLSAIDPYKVRGVQEVHELLGVGSFSEVYRCSLKGPDEQIVQVALKLYDQNFRLEDIGAGVMSELQHPHLVRVHLAIDELHCGLALELCSGGTVQNFLHGPNKKNHRELYGLQTRLLAAQGIVSALEYLHEGGFIHRDVKPGNCFLAQTPQNNLIPCLKLGELVGARRDSGDPLSSLTRFRGSIRYMAPEVIETNIYDVSADIFSLGVFLHEFLSSVIPYSDCAGNNEGWACPRTEGQLAIAIIGGKRPSFDVFSSFAACAEICEILDSCWCLPASRSSASTLMCQIKHLMCIV